MAGEEIGDDHRLDGERRRDRTRGQLFDDDLGHAEIGERLLIHTVDAPSGDPLAAAAGGDSTDPIRTL